jgi:hypothetical protein
MASLMIQSIPPKHLLSTLTRAYRPAPDWFFRVGSSGPGREAEAMLTMSGVQAVTRKHRRTVGRREEGVEEWK